MSKSAKLKVKQETPVKVLDGQVQSARIAPGEEVVGVVALQMASSPEPDESCACSFPAPINPETV